MVFTGATGPRRDQLTAIVDGGLSEPTGKRYEPHHFVLEASFNEDNNALNELAGRPPSTVTAHRLMSEVQSQRDWFNGLHWTLLAHTNPYANHHGAKQNSSLEPSGMREGSNQHCDVEFIQSGEGVYRAWQLVRRARRIAEAANLLSLDESAEG